MCMHVKATEISPVIKKKKKPVVTGVKRIHYYILHGPGKEASICRPHSMETSPL